MKESVIRSISGAVYIALLVVALLNQHALFILFFFFGIVSVSEFKKLTQLNTIIPYILFAVIYGIFGYWNTITNQGINEATQILQVITLFVQLLLIKDLFSKKEFTLFSSNKYLLSLFYITSPFVFLVLIGNYSPNHEFNSSILLGSFILVWVNDTFAYLVGKKFGRQKLFPSISPKKTVEGFLGGLLFACISSYFLAEFTNTHLGFSSWLTLSIIVSVFGTLGDLVESKFKRLANVKDSGTIMPGHGGILDRFDSIIFAAPFIYLFLTILQYVS